MLRIHQEDGGYVEIKRRKPRKKTGRKRGRPRKKHIFESEKTRKQPYSIILTSRNKQKECLKTFKTEDEAYVYFYKLLEENKNVMFPIKHLNYKGIVEARYELFILKRLDEYSTKNDVSLRNELGEFVKYDTNMDNWQIIDKADWNIEETFWVYGYDPQYQRKTFKWICDNIIGNNLSDKYTFKNILVYQNKFIVEADGNIDIVFCKCCNDAVRLYNEIESFCKDKKYKNIMFSGNLRDYSRQTITAWIDKLCETTGFDRLKIKRNSLRP